MDWNMLQEPGLLICSIHWLTLVLLNLKLITLCSPFSVFLFICLLQWKIWALYTIFNLFIVHWSEYLIFAMNQLCQLMHNPFTTHWSAIKSVLWYLKGDNQSWFIFWLQNFVTKCILWFRLGRWSGWSSFDNLLWPAFFLVSA